MLQVIAFDVFGTVINLHGVNHDDLQAYAAHIAQPTWAPLHLPESWEHLPAFPDAAIGLRRLRSKFMVVTCSNGPLGMLARLSKYASIEWDAIIPLELNRVFKPNHRAYLTVCEVLGVEPGAVHMVTANKYFGDLEAAQVLGMTATLIRGGSPVPTITALADQLGC